MAGKRGTHPFRWVDHPEIEARLQEIYRGRYSQEIADILNREFGTNFTGTQVIKHLNNEGLSLGIGKDRTGHRFFWTPEKERFVADRLDLPYSEILDQFEKEFGTRITWGSLGHFKWRHGLYSTHDTKFQPGAMPDNHSPLGTESAKGNGYTWVKVSDKRWTGNGSKNNWKPKQRVVWEEHYGPVPEGMYVTFRDGDRSNFSPDNLLLVNRAELNYMSKMGVKDMAPEARETGELVAKLRAEIYTRRKNELEEHDDERPERRSVRDDREGQ